MQRYERIFNPRDRWPALTAAIVLFAALAVVSAWTDGRINVAIFYPPLLLTVLWFRNRRLLWMLAGVLVAAIFADLLWHRGFLGWGWWTVANRSISAGLILCTAFMLQIMLRLWTVLAREHRELDERNAEPDRRRREAEEAAIRKSRFLAAVSHDIRTPVNAINLLAELIRRTAAGGPERHHEVVQLAEELKTSALALVGLVSDVLDVTRLDSVGVELVESDFGLGEALGEEIRKLTPLAREKGLELRLETEAAPALAIRLHADRTKVGRVVSNLIGNAIKYTNQGSVTVGAGQDGNGMVRISVKDTGVGIEPEDLPRIFDEFYQLRNPNRDRAKGTGLGLSISKRLIDAMGGTITVTSTPGEGTEFVMTLPVSRAGG